MQASFSLVSLIPCSRLNSKRPSNAGTALSASSSSHRSESTMLAALASAEGKVAVTAEVRRLEGEAELRRDHLPEARAKFLAAGIGITGANGLIAESGTVMLVTNEGNGRLTSSLA